MIPLLWSLIQVRDAMQLRYEASKGRRINYRFHGFTTLESGWWYDAVNKVWTNNYNFNDKEGKFSSLRRTNALHEFSSHQSCKTLRAFRRKLKKAPKGVEFILRSHWIGYDVYGKGTLKD